MGTADSRKCLTPPLQAVVQIGTPETTLHIAIVIASIALLMLLAQALFNARSLGVNCGAIDGLSRWTDRSAKKKEAITSVVDATVRNHRY